MRVGDAKALNGGEAKQKQEKADGKAQIARCCREQQQAVAVEQGGADEARQHDACHAREGCDDENGRAHIARLNGRLSQHDGADHGQGLPHVAGGARPAFPQQVEDE